MALISAFWSIIWFVITIICLIWVYQDAKSRHGSSIGCLWTLVVMILGIFGLLAYLIFGRED